MSQPSEFQEQSNNGTITMPLDEYMLKFKGIHLVDAKEQKQQRVDKFNALLDKRPLFGSSKNIPDAYSAPKDDDGETIPFTDPDMDLFDRHVELSDRCSLRYDPYISLSEDNENDFHCSTRIPIVVLYPDVEFKSLHEQFMEYIGKHESAIDYLDSYALYIVSDLSSDFLADMMKTVGNTGIAPKALSLVMQSDTPGLEELAHEIIDSPCDEIVYDQTGTYDDAARFRHDELQYYQHDSVLFGGKSHLVYTGDRSNLTDKEIARWKEFLLDRYKVAIALSVSRICSQDAHADSPGASCAISNLYVNSLSFGKLNIPEFMLNESARKVDGRNNSIDGVFAYSQFTILPSPEEQRQLDEVCEYAEKMSNVVMLWKRVFDSCGISLMPSGEMWRLEKTNPKNAKSVCENLMEIGRNCGIAAIVEAYLDGTPIEDICA